MGCTGKDAKLRGPAGFDAYYGELFGGRWQNLRAALLAESTHERVCFEGCAPYFLDPASLCAALCLPVSGAQAVLDMCAAPGGKTLVLAANLAPDARLFANERSPERRSRLGKVVQDSLPPDVQARITLSCSDAATWCRRQSECYDCILLDAPCSSERHVLKDARFLAEWTPARIRSLAQGQWALLSCAWRLLTPGGYLLYATCALSPQENDGNVARLQKKFGAAARVCPPEQLAAFFAQNVAAAPLPRGLEPVFAAAERTPAGLHLLPDTSSGGPLFFSLLQKKA